MMYNYPLISENYLSHEGRGHDENPPGRGSGRYPWGSGKNPRQGTAADMRRAKRTKRQADRIKARREKKEKEAAVVAKKAEEQKQKAIQSGDPDQVRAAQHLMTNEELRQALDRIDKMQQLNKISPSQQKDMRTAEQKVSDFMKHVDTLSGWLKTANNLYTQTNTMAKNINDIRAGNFGKEKDKDKKPEQDGNNDDKKPKK